MGTSGTALFADDVACDVRDAVVEFLRAGGEPAASTQQIMRQHGALINDEDDGPVFWLARAATQWKYGCLDDAVRARAIAVIDGGADAARWTGAAAQRRQKVLDALRAQLTSPQPRLRRPRRRVEIVIPSVKVPSPDGTALAVASERRRPDHPDGPQMQVILHMVSNGSWGGGNVTVEDCDYRDVVLTWLGPDTLQIGYPAPVVPDSRATTNFYCGRVINIVHKAVAS